MKKLILFFLIIYGAAAADWRNEAERFREVERGTGFKNVPEFITFLDRAEGIAAENESLFFHFTGDPSAFADRFGIGLTLLLVLFGGLMLNLTPCVLPMIPINLAIIGASAQSGTRARGFALGGVYGAGIAAVYGILGLVVLFSGKGFGALNANPWFNLIIAGVFFALALAMAGVFRIDFTGLRHDRADRLKNRYLAAFIMGGVAALLAGACVAPVVIAVLLLAAETYAQGNSAGLLLPFVFGIGMALPWPLAGGGLSLLPKPGRWMNVVKYSFAALIFLFAVRYAALAISLFRHSTPAVDFIDFETELAAARAAGESVFLDFTADWCTNCKQMERETFSDPAVQKRLAKYRFIKIDATHFDQSPAKEILEFYNVRGLPTFIILEPIQR